MRAVLILAVLAFAACTPVKIVGNAVIGAGQVVLGAADAVI
jgi:hypothetical protein